MKKWKIIKLSSYENKDLQSLDLSSLQAFYFAFVLQKMAKI